MVVVVVVEEEEEEVEEDTLLGVSARRRGAERTVPAGAWAGMGADRAPRRR